MITIDSIGLAGKLRPWVCIDQRMKKVFWYNLVRLLDDSITANEKKNHAKINITGIKQVSQAARRRDRLRLFFADHGCFVSDNSQSYFYLFDIIECDVSNSQSNTATGNKNIAIHINTSYWHSNCAFFYSFSVYATLRPKRHCNVSMFVCVWALMATPICCLTHWSTNGYIFFLIIIWPMGALTPHSFPSLWSVSARYKFQKRESWIHCGHRISLYFFFSFFFHFALSASCHPRLVHSFCAFLYNLRARIYDKIN